MPPIHRTAEIDVRAPASAAFAVVAGDIMAVNDRPDSMTGHRPVSGGPLRHGYRWQQTIVHDRHVCRTDWTVTALGEPGLLEQEFAHLCTATGAVSEGGERWEFLPAEDGATLVTLRSWRNRHGLAGWLEKAFGSCLTRDVNVSLMKRLAYVQFEAERRAAP